MKQPLLRVMVAVALTVALAFALGYVPTRQATRAPITVTGTRTLACPAGDPTTLTTTVLAGAADSVSSRVLGESGSGSAQRFLKAPVSKPMVLSGGATLGGLSTSTMASGVYRGLWLAPCRAPAAEHWFSGVVSSAQERATVELVNVDPTQAVVDLTILGKDGRVTAPGARGLTVPGNSSRNVALEPLLTSADPVGVQVRASEGRIAATVRMSGDTGADWAVAAATPSLTQVVPVVLSGEGARTLIVTNPGNRRASVTVEAWGATSSFAPAGADTFDVNAESTLAVPLENSLKGEAVGLKVTATVPVTAGVRIVSGGDIALIGSAGPLAEGVQTPAVAGAIVGLVNAGATAATVTLTTRTAEGGTVDSTRTVVEPGRFVKLPVTGDRTATFELAADSSDVRAAVAVTAVGEQTGVAVAVLGGGASGSGVYDPTLDPGLAR